MSLNSFAGQRKASWVVLQSCEESVKADEVEVEVEVERCGLGEGLENEGSNPLSAYNVMSQPHLMESIWGKKRYVGKEENEGGCSGASRVKINKLVEGLKGGISESLSLILACLQQLFFCMHT